MSFRKHVLIYLSYFYISNIFNKIDKYLTVT